MNTKSTTASTGIQKVILLELTELRIVQCICAVDYLTLFHC